MFQPSLFITAFGSAQFSEPKGLYGVYSSFKKQNQELPRPDALVLVHGFGSSSSLEVAEDPTYFSWQEHIEADGQIETLRFSTMGSPELARIIVELIKRKEQQAQLISRKEIDPPVLAPLQALFPELYFPLVQLSLPQEYTPHDYWTMGQALSELREENVLILAVGQVESSAQRNVGISGQEIESGELEFLAQWGLRHLAEGKWDGVLDNRGPPGPSEPTFLRALAPLWFALGAGGKVVKTRKIQEEPPGLMNLLQFSEQ